MLEVVQIITEPLLAKLRFHFASGRPTDRIDQPDWLFDTAAKATQENLEAFKVLQPAVEQHGLERVFYLPFEFARAMHAAVQTVLKEHVLPRLAQQVQMHQIHTLMPCHAVMCQNHIIPQPVCRAGAHLSISMLASMQCQSTVFAWSRQLSAVPSPAAA